MIFLVGFSSRKSSIFSKLLQIYMKTDYSHCYLQFNDYWGQPIKTIFHSSFPAGTSIINSELFHQKNTTVRLYQLQVSEEDYYEIKSLLFSKIGTSYNMFQNLGVLFYDILKLIGIKIKNPFTKDYNCSELIYEHLFRKHNLTEKDPNLITPKDIENLLIKVNAMRIL